MRKINSKEQKSRGLMRSRVRDPECAVSRANSGFTLVEVIMATVISVMVFAAMGILLSRCFSLWMDAMAHWQMAQTTRIARERILCGGFANPSDGLLSAEFVTNTVTGMETGWSYLGYQTIEDPAIMQQIRGWPGAASDKNIQLKKSAGWVFAQSTGSGEPLVKIDSFSAASTSDLVTIRYRTRLAAAGRTFVQPHTIRARLVNVETD